MQRYHMLRKKGLVQILEAVFETADGVLCLRPVSTPTPFVTLKDAKFAVDQLNAAQPDSAAVFLNSQEFRSRWRGHRSRNGKKEGRQLRDAYAAGIR